MKGNVRNALVRMKRMFWETEIEKIANALNSGSAEIVASALNNLRKAHDLAHGFQAINLLSHYDENVVVAALKYLKSLKHPLEAKQGHELIKRGRKIKSQMALCLDLFAQKDACKFLKKLLNEESVDVLSCALKNVGKFECEEISKLVKPLTNFEEISVRIAALEALYVLGEEVDEEALNDIIFDPSTDENLKKKALKIALEISSSPRNILRRVVEEGNSSLVAITFAFMEKYDLDCEKIDDILNVESQSALVLSSALHFLLRTGENESMIERVAMKWRDHVSKKVRILSFKLLDKIDSAYAPETLSKLLFSRDTEVLKAIIPYVYRYPSEENMKKLDKLMDNSDERVIRAVLRVFRKLHFKSERVLEYLDRSHPIELRNEALKNAIEFKLVTPEALENVLSAEESVKIKLTALEGLARLAPEKLEKLEVA